MPFQRQSSDGLHGGLAQDTPSREAIIGARHDEKRCRERERVPGGCMLDVGFLTRDQFYHYIYTALLRAIRRFACLQSSKSHETERPGMRVAA
jgi:hypothetical protein